MSKIAFDKDHEFTLDSIELGSIVVEDPLNWDEDDKTYKYDKLGGGTLEKINTNLEFYGEGHDFIKSHPLVFGFDSEISVTKRIKDPYKKGEDWRISYQASLDLTQSKFDRSRTTPIAKIPFTQGGLYDRIKARYSTKFDLVEPIDADGNAITELDTIIEQVTGREIFRRSVAEVEDGARVQHPVSGADKDVARAIPFTVNPNSDNDNINSIVLGSEQVGFNNGGFANGTIGSILFSRSDRKRTRTLNGKVKIRIVDSDIGFVRLYKVFYKYNTTSNIYEFIQGREELLGNYDASTLNSELEYDFVNDDVTLEADEAMTLVWYSNTEDGWGYEYYDTQVIITEDESYPATVAKDLLPLEFFDRFVEKITGEKGLVVSNVFGRIDKGYDQDGEWANLALSSGYWARGFDLGDPIINKDTGDPEPKKQFTISFKEGFNGFYVPVPLMWSVEKIKGKEFVRIEKYEYTQQDFVGIRLGRDINGVFQHLQASKPIEETLTANLYTGAEIGYVGGDDDYEEVSGLSSPHGIGQFSMSLKRREENVYSKTSVIRADLEGFDLARRKESIYFPDTDTPYDSKIFFRHLKKIGTNWTLRKWQDDFEEEPKNIYSPSTSGNLLLTPFRCALRHGRILATSVSKKPNEKFVKVSVEGKNNKLITKLPGEDEIAENGFVLNKKLGVPFINGFMLKFDGKVYQSMVDEIEGSTTIDGEEVPNWYGLFEVMVGDTLQYGRLIKSNITKGGKHEIALI